MIQHPYCRTCGSRIQNKNVCPHCGCEPLKGNHYCCDCGTPTMPQAIMCVHCGASFQTRFPATLAILIGAALIITLAATGYFISQSNSGTSEELDNTSKTNIIDSTGNKLRIRKWNESTNIITNNISIKPPAKNDAISRIARNIIPKNLLPENEPKPSSPKDREETVSEAREKNPVTPARTGVNVFSPGELRAYSVGCTYFEGKRKSNVIFFTTSVYGYIKINGKTYALQGVQKGNDIARFVGAGYEVTIEIEGLAGNENEWFATGTIVVRDTRQRTLSSHRFYSSCTDF